MRTLYEALFHPRAAHIRENWDSQRREKRAQQLEDRANKHFAKADRLGFSLRGEYHRIRGSSLLNAADIIKGHFLDPFY